MICNCNLPPESCKNCIVRIQQENSENEPFFRYDIQYPMKKVVTKTIEKYGSDGQYLGKEIITEETQDIINNTTFTDYNNIQQIRNIIMETY